MYAKLTFITLALLLAAPLQAAERGKDTDIGKAGDAVELEMSRWRSQPGQGGEFVAAEQLLQGEQRSAEARRLNEANFDLLMIRRDWNDDGGWKR